MPKHILKAISGSSVPCGVNTHVQDCTAFQAHVLSLHRNYLFAGKQNQRILQHAYTMYIATLKLCIWRTGHKT